MKWNKIMRFVYWSLSSVFFFAALVMTVSILKPGPTEIQVMRFMSGMMSAMHNSMMGASMDNMRIFMSLLSWSAGASVVMIILGIAVGIPLKTWRKL
ncbi:MAG: hypothetical protein RO469_16185 [Thermincola sp.]|nr:hypothetical protein [Thermincola sp.]MDT3704780.1 hypothetical protein [Thermincola sp.]